MSGQTVAGSVCDLCKIEMNEQSSIQRSEWRWWRYSESGYLDYMFFYLCRDCHDRFPKVVADLNKTYGPAEGPGESL